MITKTSDELWIEYQKAKKLEEKLDRRNRGLNILNADKFFKPDKFFIEVKKEVELNLVNHSSKLVVDTDFPFCDWKYGYGEINPEYFLQQLKEWISIPRYNFFLQHNRKRDNKASWINLPKFRKVDIQFEDIDFRIGEQAQHDINLLGFDFIKTVKKLLSQQREATDKEAKDFERFKFLLEEIENLERQIPKRNEYSYYQKKDRTIKITIDKKTYNEKLKIVEQELKKLCKKYSFLEMPKIDYEEIPKKLSFKDWKAENGIEANDNWVDFDDEEKEEYDGDFENYLKFCYEYYIENTDFD